MRLRRNVNCNIWVSYPIQFNYPVSFDRRTDPEVLINTGIVKYYCTVFRMDIRFHNSFPPLSENSA